MSRVLEITFCVEVADVEVVKRDEDVGITKDFIESVELDVWSSDDKPINSELSDYVEHFAQEHYKDEILKLGKEKLEDIEREQW